MGKGDIDWNKQLVEATAYPVIVADDSGTIRVWNVAAAALFGYDAAEAIGKPTALIIPGNFQTAHAACYRNAMQSGRSYSGHQDVAVPATHRDGTTIKITGNLSVLQDTSGNVTGAALIVRSTEKPE